jgi:hypothetical protein
MSKSPETSSTQEKWMLDLWSDEGRRQFAERFMEAHPGMRFGAVVDALPEALQRIGPSDDHETLVKAVREVIGSAKR